MDTVHQTAFNVTDFVRARNFNLKSRLANTKKKGRCFEPSKSFQTSGVNSELQSPKPRQWRYIGGEKSIDPWASCYFRSFSVGRRSGSEQLSPVPAHSAHRVSCKRLESGVRQVMPKWERPNRFELTEPQKWWEVNAHFLRLNCMLVKQIHNLDRLLFACQNWPSVNLSWCSTVQTEIKPLQVGDSQME